MLRINADGTIPTDNPFYNTATGQNRAIWALGLRNPFTFAFQPGTGRMFINDVGQNAWEEINDGIAGSNYGWPTTEGPTTDPRFRSPIFSYGHGGTSTTGCAITGGAFYNPPTAQFPASYVGDYFFADYCNDWIRKLDPAAGNTAADFASGASGPGRPRRSRRDGSLYYLTRGAGGSVFRVAYTASQAPAITTHPASQTVGVGSPATFSVSASGSRAALVPVAAQRRRHPRRDLFRATRSPRRSPPTTARASASRVTNSFGNATSNEAVLTVTANQPPTATITAPAAGTLYRGGDTIAYAGTGTDPEDGTLGGSRFTWRVDFHHADHVHPFLPPTSGATSGSFMIPTTGHTESNVWYRIHLTVTDSGGLTSSTFRDVNPRLVQIQLATNPSGLQLRLDGQPVTAPLLVHRRRRASSGCSRRCRPRPSGSTQWVFSSWSNGGAREQTISTPDVNTTYTATYSSSAAAAAGVKVNFQPASAPTVRRLPRRRRSGLRASRQRPDLRLEREHDGRRVGPQLEAVARPALRHVDPDAALEQPERLVGDRGAERHVHACGSSRATRRRTNSVFRVNVEGVLTVSGDADGLEPLARGDADGDGRRRPADDRERRRRVEQQALLRGDRAGLGSA